MQCACDDGFSGNGYVCQDIDECSKDPTLCENGQCLNYPGSFRCECEMGFMHPDERNEQSCVGKFLPEFLAESVASFTFHSADIDECQMFSNLCVFGKCENIYGMFRCICDKGFQLDESGGNCTDIDECENPQACQYGTCINSQGSYVCQCPPHHELIPSQNGCVGESNSSCPKLPLLNNFFKKIEQTNEWLRVT